MMIKSYFAKAVEDAVDMARQELGADAMLVSSRRTQPEAQHLGDYEVVFALPHSSPPAPEPETAPPASVAGNDISGRLSSELAELRRQMESMRRTLSRSSIVAEPWLGNSPDASEAYSSLVNAEVPPELARDVVHAAEMRLGGARVALRGVPRGEHSGFARALVEEMESRFSTRPVLGRSEARPRVAALVGPPGAGKTTTLTKLAVHYGLTARKPVALLSIDNYRVGGSEQLRSFAAILGVAFQALETVAALGQAIEEHRNKDLILIDTPGFGFPDLEDATLLARFLASRSDVDAHLVLSASMKSADLSRVIDAFEMFGPAALLFTRLDETTSFGPLFHEAVRTGKPLSFFGIGQRIPEDLETAEKGRLIARILANRPAEALSAA